MNKRILSAALAFVLAVCALALAQRLLVPKYQTGIVEGSMIEEYYRDVALHEVVMIGDCEIYENISPITLFQEYGISSVLRGSAQQLAWHSYVRRCSDIFSSQPIAERPCRPLRR